MPDAQLPRLIRPTKSEPLEEWIRRLRYVQHKYFPVCLPTDAYALTLIDPMLPLFARPPLDGLFFSWLTADRKPATSLPAYQSAAPHHKWPASFPHPMVSPARRSRRAFTSHSPGSKIGLSSSCGGALHHSAKASVCALQSGAPNSSGSMMIVVDAVRRHWHWFD